MIIIIPLGGIGDRFKKRGFKEPKALIEVEQKPILFHLLDNLNLQNIDFVYIPYNKEYESHDIENKVKNRLLFLLIYYGLRTIKSDLIVDCI